MSEMGRVLLADDEELFLNTTADLLREQGYTVDTAPDGGSAAEMLGAAEYDVLVADIIMEGNRDLELVRKLPDLAEDLPVVLVTAHASVKNAVDGIRLHVDGYVQKDPKEEMFSSLLSEVRKAVRRSRTQRAIRESRSQLTEWMRELEKMTEETKASEAPGTTLPVDAFVGLTFRNIITSLSGLRHLTESIAKQGAGTPTDACPLFSCPRLDRMQEAVTETIEVLWETKGSFKSARLADHRRKLQELVEELGIGSRPGPSAAQGRK